MNLRTPTAAKLAHFQVLVVFDHASPDFRVIYQKMLRVKGLEFEI